MDTLVLILTLAGFALGALLVARGYRRRVQTNLRFCANCAYHADGLASSTCPECGSDLARPNAVTMGRRHPDRIMISAGAALLILLSGIQVTHYYVQFRSVDLVPYMPTWWLLRSDITASSAYASDEMLELRRRCALGDLSEKQLRTFADILAKRAQAMFTSGNSSRPATFTGNTLQLLRDHAPDQSVVSSLLDALVDFDPDRFIDASLDPRAQHAEIVGLAARYEPFLYPFDQAMDYPAMVSLTRITNVSDALGELPITDNAARLPYQRILDVPHIDIHIEVRWFFTDPVAPLVGSFQTSPPAQILRDPDAPIPSLDSPWQTTTHTIRIPAAELQRLMPMYHVIPDDL